MPLVTTPTTVVTIGFDDGTADQFAARHGARRAQHERHVLHQQRADLGRRPRSHDGRAAGDARRTRQRDRRAHGRPCEHPAAVDGGRDTRGLRRSRSARHSGGVQEGFPAPISFAYPFGSYDANSEAIVAGCGYDSARTVSGVSIHVAKGKIGETVPPADPTPRARRPTRRRRPSSRPWRSTSRMPKAGVAATGQDLWIQFVFHRYCPSHCGAYTIQPDKFTALLGLPAGGGTGAAGRRC